MCWIISRIFGGEEYNGAVSFLLQNYVCIEFYANYKVILQYNYHNVMLSLQETTQHMLVTFLSM